MKTEKLVYLVYPKLTEDAEGDFDKSELAKTTQCFSDDGDELDVNDFDFIDWLHTHAYSRFPNKKTGEVFGLAFWESAYRCAVAVKGEK